MTKNPLALSLDDEVQVDILDMALERFIAEHVEDYDYVEAAEFDDPDEIRKHRMEDVAEAEVLLLRLDLLRPEV